jgi:energy-coupling factor transporter ATP-binding protein EcfA2
MVSDLGESTQTPERTVPAAKPFRSFAEARLAHSTILKRRNAATVPGDEVEDFARRLQATGASLWEESERTLAQSMLDYWATVLNRDKGWSEPLLLAEFDSERAPELPDSDCPYVGLHPFGSENQHLFYGRDELVQSIIKRVEDERFVAIIGPSGSGKSSLIQAGVLPRLADGKKFAIVGPVLPGVEPLRALAGVLASDDDPEAGWETRHKAQFLSDPHHLRTLLDAKTSGKPALLVVDQCEELFTLCPDGELQQAFLRNFAGLISERDQGPQHHLLLSLREDYAGSLLRDSDLEARFERAQIRLSPLSAKSLREAIEKPAEQVGLRFESGIVEDLVAKVLGEPAALPLLQFTLMALWNTRKRNIVTWSDYEKLGGPRRALAQSADALYKSLTIEEQNTARRIFTRLVQFGDSLEVTSRRVAIADLAKIEDPLRVRRVIAKFEERRLLRVSGDAPEGIRTPGTVGLDQRVEVAHEALIRNWPALVEWLDQERARLRQRLQLTAAARLWQAHGRDPGGLLGGSLLEQAQGYDDLSSLEHDLVRDSLKAQEAARLEREQSQRIREEILEKRLEEERARAEASQARADADRARAEAAERQVKLTRRSILAAGAVAAVPLVAYGVQWWNQQALDDQRKRADQARYLAAQARDRAEDLQRQLDVLRGRLITTTLRPLLRVQDGTFSDPPLEWSALNEHRASINRILRSVGSLTGRGGRGVVTGFMVGPDALLTINLISDAATLRVSFADRAVNFEDAPFEIIELLLKERFSGGEVNLLRVRALAGSNLPLPPPLPLAESIQIHADALVYTVGYPQFGDDIPAKILIDMIGDDVRNAKRLQPGRVLKDPDNDRVTYDCSTFYGNAGGPVVDLASGRLFAMHYGGPPSVGKYGVLLGKLPRLDRMRELGVMFQFQ